MEEKISWFVFLIIFSCSIGFGPLTVNAQFLAAPGFNIEYRATNPWSDYSYNQTQVRDLLSFSNIVDVESITPFSTYESHTGESKDPFFSSFVNITSSSNLWGKSTESGRASYVDPWSSAGGQYVEVGLPTMAFSSDSASYANVMGAGGSVSSLLDTPWFHFESSIGSESKVGTAVGPFGFPLAAQSFERDTFYASYGKENIFSLTMHPAFAGAAILRANAPQIGQMDRVLSDTPMFTKDGQKFYATTGYYNYADPSHWFFPEEISTTETRVNTVGGAAVSGYYTGTSVGRNVVSPGIRAVPYGYVPSGVGSASVTGRGVVSSVAGGSYNPGAYGGGAIGRGGVISTPRGVPTFYYGSGY